MWESCLICLGGDTLIVYDNRKYKYVLMYLTQGESQFAYLLFSCFSVYFSHIRLCVCLVFQEIYKLIQLSGCLHLQLMDSSQVEFVVMGILLYQVVLVFEHFILYESFVTNCQRRSLLGSKCLEQLANREHKLVQIQILESIGFIRKCSR